MTPFVVIFIILTLLTLKSSPTFRGGTIYTLILLILILFCGLREPMLYPDMGNYRSFFFTGEMDAESMLSSTKKDDIGYLYLNKIFHTVIGSFQLYCLFLSGVMIGLYSMYIKKYSPYPILSLWLFAIIGYLYQFFLLRQCLSVSVGLLAFKYVLEKKPVHFVISVLLAASIHNTAILLFPFYYVFHVFYDKKKWRIFLFAMSGIAIILFKIIANLVFSSYDYYAHYLEGDSEVSIPRILMKGYILLLYLVTLKNDAFIKDIRFLLLICFLMNIIIYVGCDGIYGAYRLRFFFEISEIVGIPFIIRYARRKKTIVKFITNVMIVIYLCLITLSAFNFLSSDNMAGGYELFL